MINNTVCMLNIGLARNEYAGPKLHTTSDVLGVLKAYGILNNQTVCWTSSTEPTLVIHGVAPSDAAIYAVASLLNQDCIAVWNVEEQTGSLIGPRPEKWGKFDPAQFITLTGETLAEVN